MPVGERPILDIVIRQLARAQFERVTIATGYLAELIEAFFGDGSRYGIPIDYFRDQAQRPDRAEWLLLAKVVDRDAVP
jgi:NDP-sugar pyrophosphorylase family protein